MQSRRQNEDDSKPSTIEERRNEYITHDKWKDIFTIYIYDLHI